MAGHTYKTLTISPIRSSAYAMRVTISNPPINTVDSTFLGDFHTFLGTLQNRASTEDQTAPKVVVFSSSDDEIWLSHLDLHLISANYPAPPDVDSQATLHRLGETLQLLQSLPTIFIAEIDGLAVGGGNEFAVSMDMRFVGPNARFGIPEVAGGLVHGGGLHRLTKLIGPARALQWNLSARGTDGKEAAKIGWVNEAFETREHLKEYVDDLAERIAMFPRGGIESTKLAVMETLDESGSMEKDMERLVKLVRTEEVQHAVGGFIELGGDHARSDFELGLPDSAASVWKSS